jgi:hypothetical protein
MSDVSSMSKEERRALAIAKLSKAFGGKGGRPAARGGEDEVDFLREVLETMDVGKIHRMVKVEIPLPRLLVATYPLQGQPSISHSGPAASGIWVCPGIMML